MILTASSDPRMSAGTMVLVTCFSVFMLISGVRHYRGHGRWLLPLLPTEVSFFGPGWFGAFGLMVVLCELADRVSVALAAVLAIPMFVLLLITIMSLVWLPTRLLPSWYLDRRRQARSVPARALR